MRRKSILVLAAALFVFTPWASQSAFAGRILVWGNFDYLEEPWDFNSPYQPEGNSVDIDTSGRHFLSIKDDGSLQAWGQNTYGQCDVPAGNNFVKVECGDTHSLALRDDGTLVAWGNNQHGECDYPDGNDFIDISAGIAKSLAIKSDGSIVSWGYKYLEDPNDPNSGEPPAGNDYIAIAAGKCPYSSVNLALKSDGSIVAWGQNTYGQCLVPETNDFVDIAVGSRRCLVLKADGSLICWGSEYYPIDVNSVDSYEDILLDVPAGNDYVDIACGWYHNLAIKSDGSIVAWGRNINGQCNVPSGNDFVAIAAGDEHSMALTSDAVKILTMGTIPAGLDCVVPGQGNHSYYSGQRVFVSAPRCSSCPDVYKFDHWEGDIDEPNSISQYLTMDRDRIITAFYSGDQRVCGDECHPILQGDLNEDCYINFEDFALYALMWMSCTHPDCD